ncbi:hypothetical protein ACO3VM_01145 [Methanocaldococcus sp. 10A]
MHITIIDEFFELVVESIEEHKEDIKYAVCILKIITNYMESKNQKVPDWVYEWIEDREEFVNEVERFKKEGNVLITSKDFKTGIVGGVFIGGMIPKSKMKIVEKLPNIEFGIIEVDGAVIEILLRAMSSNGGYFMAEGVRDEEHLKKIIKVIEESLEKDIIWYDK